MPPLSRRPLSTVPRRDRSAGRPAPSVDGGASSSRPRAFHEAAHAVAAWVVGTRIIDLSLDPAHYFCGVARLARWNLAGDWRPSAEDARRLACDGIVTAAGLDAGRRYCRRSGLTGVAGDDADENELMLLASACGDARDAFHARCRGEAKRILDAPGYWRAVEEVARELSRRGRMSAARARSRIAGVVMPLGPLTP